MCYIIQASNLSMCSILGIGIKRIELFFFSFCSHVDLRGLVLSDSTGLCPVGSTGQNQQLHISICVMFSVPIYLFSFVQRGYLY